MVLKNGRSYQMLRIRINVQRKACVQVAHRLGIGSQEGLFAGSKLLWALASKQLAVVTLALS